MVPVSGDEDGFFLLGDSPAGSERNFSGYSMFTLGEARQNEDGFFGVTKIFKRKNTVTSPENSKALLRCFKEAIDSIASFKKELSDKSQKLYQRQAQIGKIHACHEQWKNELKSSHAKMSSALNEARLHYTYIDTIDSPTQTATAFRDMIRIETSSRPLLQLYDELVCVLASDELHQPALEFYKIQKKACKALKDKTSGNEKINGLMDIFVLVQGKINTLQQQITNKKGIVVQESLLLYRELLKFVTYTANSFRTKNEDPAPPPDSSWWASWLHSWPFSASTPTQPPANLNERIDKLVENIVGAESELSKICPRPARAALTGEKRKKIEAYIAKCPKGSPQVDDDFRKGRFFEKAYYKEMRPQIEQLQGVAKALNQLQITAEEHLLSLSEGTTPISDERGNYKTIIKGLEELIYETQDSLLTLPPSNKVHAGWYYVARLVAKVRQVRMSLWQFNGVNSPEFKPYVAAINRLASYLDIKGTAHKKNLSYINSEKAVKHLYSSAQTASWLVRPHSEQRSLESLCCTIYDAIEKILAKLGPKTLELSAVEATVPMRVITKSSPASFRNAEETDQSLIPILLFTYLIKGFARKIYFMEKAINPEFEVVLRTLHEHELYKPLMDNLCSFSEGFKVIFETYTHQSQVLFHTPQIAMMDKALELVLKDQGALNPLQMLCHYCQAQQITCDLTAQAPETVSATHRMHLDWLTATIIPTFTQIEQSCHYPDYFKNLSSIGIRKNEAELDPIIYKLIVTALYSADPYKTGKEAREQLKTILSHYAYDQLPVEHHIRTLLWIYVFENFMSEKPEKLPHEKLLLDQFFITYLSDPTISAMWRKKYGLDYMELAVRKFGPQQDMRDPNTRYLWEYALTSYSEFLTTFKPNTSQEVKQRRQQLYNDLGQELNNLSSIPPLTDNPMTHIGIAQWCHSFMGKKLASLEEI